MDIILWVVGYVFVGFVMSVLVGRVKVDVAFDATHAVIVLVLWPVFFVVLVFAVLGFLIVRIARGAGEGSK